MVGDSIFHGGLRFSAFSFVRDKKRKLQNIFFILFFKDLVWE